MNYITIKKVLLDNAGVIIFYIYSWNKKLIPDNLGYKLN